MNERIQALCAYLNGAKSVYHAQDLLVKELEKAGYVRLSEAEGWELVPGGKYFVTRGGTAVLAFRILDKLGMDPEEIADIVTAIGNHDEGTGRPVSPMAAITVSSARWPFTRVCT